jgi:hypothetical protein
MPRGGADAESLFPIYRAVFDCISVNEFHGGFPLFRYEKGPLLLQVVFGKRQAVQASKISYDRHNRHHDTNPLY